MVIDISRVMGFLGRNWGALSLGIALAVAPVAGVGCSGVERTDEEVGTISQAVVEGQEEISLALSLPEAASLAEIAVAAQEHLALADRSKVEGDASVNAGNANVGVEAQVRDLFIQNQLSLRDRSHVFGKAFAKQVERGNSVLVDGGITLVPATPAPVSYAWKVSVGAASLGNVMLEPDRRRDLPPGKYGTFSITSRSTVTLHSGIYVLNDFMLEPQAKLRIDDRDGPVQVLVKGT